MQNRNQNLKSISSPSCPDASSSKRQRTIPTRSIYSLKTDFERIESELFQENSAEFDIRLNILQLSGEEKVTLSTHELCLLLSKARDQKAVIPSELSLEGMLKRRDLVYWTSLQDPSLIRDFWVPMLEKYYLLCISLKKANSLPKLPILLENRVTWVFMRMTHPHVSWERLGILFSSTNTYQGTWQNLSRVIKNTAKHMKKAITSFELIRWPDVERLRAVSAATTDLEAGKLIFIVDGTSLPIKKPTLWKLCRLMWVHYKKHHAYRWFLITLANGEIVFLSKLGFGVDSDDKSLVYENVNSHLEQYSSDWLLEGETYTLGGDKGYIYTQLPAGWELLITESGLQELQQGPAADQHLDHPIVDVAAQSNSPFVRRFLKAFAKPRAVVERTIQKVKKWPVLSTPISRFKDDQKILMAFVHIGSVMANIQILSLAHCTELLQRADEILTASESESSEDSDSILNQ